MGFLPEGRFSKPWGWGYAPRMVSLHRERSLEPYPGHKQGRKGQVRTGRCMSYLALWRSVVTCDVG